MKRKKVIVITVTLCILGLSVLLIGAGSTCMDCGSGHAKPKLTLLYLKQMQSMIYQFQLIKNRLPENLSELSTCMYDDKTPCKILQGDDARYLKDAWGTEIEYETTGKNTYLLRSFGADQKRGGTRLDSDLVVSEPQN